MNLDKKLQGFQLIAQEKLQAIICSIPGQKDLILEQSLIKTLEHICSASWLKLKGIQRIYKFDAHSTIPRTEFVQVIMIRSQVQTFQRVLQHIQEQERLHPTHISDAVIKNFHIICVPSSFAHFNCLLEDEGLYGLVQLHRYNWDFIYLDQGVLSMEVPDVFASAFLHADTSLLPSIAQSLRILQMICGRPDSVLTFGEHANSIMKMLNTLGRPWKNNGNSEEPVAEFSSLLIIDRDRDYTSSLLTPAIYSGLLLEVFNNRAGEVVVETNTNKVLQQKIPIFLLPKYKEQLTARQSAELNAKPNSKPSIIRMNSLSDEIYGENRYKHFAQASSLVRAQAKAIGLEVHKLNDMKLDEMHDYVARKLPKISELKVKIMRHLNASEKVIEMLAANFRKLQSLEEDILNNVSRKRLLTEIDEMLTIDGQRYNTLRLMCLLHLCAGVGPEELTQFIRNYCNYFGAQHLHAFQQLARAGLLPPLPDEDKLMNKSAKLLSNLPLPKFQQTEFQANANRLKLLISSASADANPSTSAGGGGGSSNSGACPSYVFNSMYIPLVAQLCSFLLKSTSAEDFGNKVGTVEGIQLHLSNFSTSSAFTTFLSAKSYSSCVKQGDVKDIFPFRKRNIFVYVVGGVTYAEIGACDLIARLTGSQIVVASDSIISGADLIAGACL